jgi:glycosyltransferase involved in cell wall biosynthesis
VAETGFKLFNLRAPFGKRKLVLYFGFYWMWVLSKLAMSRPKVVHACDLDSAIPCYIYKILFRKKLVFDVCDRYAMGYIPPRFKTLYSIVNSIEEMVGERSDTLVNVSEELEETFKRRPKRLAIIMNCPEQHKDNNNYKINTNKNENENGGEDKEKKTLTLVYTGIVVRTRGLLEVGDAIRGLKGIKFVIAGRPVDTEFSDKLMQMPNVYYKGLLSHRDALVLQSRSDVMVSLYDLSDPINNYSMGNKIFEAMMFGMPVITNVSADVINEAGSGIIVGYNNIDQIKEAIVSLRDNLELRDKLGNNGHRAFMRKYNWTNMEKELYKIYDELIGK